jgi:anthranilate phosphoribosyltransferase
VQPELDRAKLPGPTLDVCGTGGDKQGFFNVSTAVMFAAAAAGACVMKHGNRSVTSKTGAADVLEELGVKIELTPDELRASLEQHGVAFIFAPAFHPAFKAVAPVRKSLAAQGQTTIFNILGPLLNPAQPDFQLVGIYNAAMLPKYAETLRALGRKRAWAVHGEGTDELTLTGPSEIHTVEADKVSNFTITPEELGLTRCTPADLLGGEPQDSVRQALIGLQEMVKGELCSEDVTVVLLLPDDETPLAQRAVALGQWCQGFLGGFGLTARDGALSAEAMEVLQDLSAIAQVQSALEESEDGESDYMEVMEYLRVAPMLLFSECTKPVAPAPKPLLH